MFLAYVWVYEKQISRNIFQLWWRSTCLLFYFLFFIFFSNFNCASSQCHEWITRLRRYKWFILGWIPIAALIQSMKTKYFKPADILSMQFVTYDFVVLFCTGDIFSPSWDRDPSSMTLPEVSSIFPPPLFSSLLKFSVTLIEGLMTEDVVHCTVCKTHWGNVIVILGYLNKIDLIYLEAPWHVYNIMQVT